MFATLGTLALVIFAHCLSYPPVESVVRGLTRVRPDISASLPNVMLQNGLPATGSTVSWIASLLIALVVEGVPSLGMKSTPRQNNAVAKQCSKETTMVV